MNATASNLLVVLAGLSTVVAGLRGWESPSPLAGTSVASLPSSAFDGCREDDSGTRGEECEEEDDREDKAEREVHLHATTALTRVLEAGAAFLEQGFARDEARLERQSSPIRGPPAGV